MSDGDPIEVEKFRAFRGGEIPPGDALNIAEIAEEQDMEPEQVAYELAETAISSVYDGTKDDEWWEEGLREEIKDMQSAVLAHFDGRQGRAQLRQAFKGRLAQWHNQVLDAREQADEPDEDLCQHIKDDGEQCQNAPEEGSDYCYIESHDPGEEE